MADTRAASSPRILIISDGKAGHISISRGIAEIFTNQCSGTVDILQVRLRWKFLRPLLRLLVNLGIGSRLLGISLSRDWPRLFYHGYECRQADMVISTGGDTLYLNALAGMPVGRPNIFCGSLRGIDARLFSLIIHTKQAPLANWLAMELLPAWMPVDAIETTAKTFVVERLHGHDNNYWALLIGGDGNGYHFDADTTVSALNSLHTLAARHGKRLLVTTSRRTNRQIEKAIEDWLERQPRPAIAYCVLYGRKPERLAGAFMHLAEKVFCTEDSTSMISESVLSQRPVFALYPPSATPAVNQAEFIHRLEDKGHIIRLNMSALQDLDLDNALYAWIPYNGEERQRLQERLLSLLPPILERDHTT